MKKLLLTLSVLVGFATVTQAKIEPLLPRNLVHRGTNVTGNGFSLSPRFIGNSKDILFLSEASNLVPGDTNEALDLFLYRASSNQVELVAPEATHFIANRDGRVIAFQSEASTYNANDRNEAADVFVRMPDGAVRTVSRSVAHDGTAQSGSELVGMDEAGTVVLFKSDAADLVSTQAWQHGVGTYYVHEVATGKARVIAPGGSNCGTSNCAPRFQHGALSPDGRYVVLAKITDVHELFLVDLQTSAPPVHLTNSLPHAFIRSEARFDASSSYAYVDTSRGILQITLNTGTSEIIDTGSVQQFAAGPTGILATYRQTLNGGILRLAQPSGTINLFTNLTHNISNLRFNPTGTRLYFVSHLNPATKATNSAAQLFWVHLETFAVVLVSSSEGPISKDVVDYDLSFSSGTVAMSTAAPEWIVRDGNKVADIFLLSENPTASLLVSRAAPGVDPDPLARFEVLPSVQPHQISSNFNTVVLNTYLPLLASDTNGLPDIYTYNRSERKLTLITSTANGFQGKGPSYDATISPDGKYVAFSSLSQRSGDTNRPAAVVSYLAATDGSKITYLAEQSAQSLRYMPRAYVFSGNSDYLLAAGPRLNTTAKSSLLLHHITSGQTWMEEGDPQTGNLVNPLVFMSPSTHWFTFNAMLFTPAPSRFTNVFAQARSQQFLTVSEVEDLFLTYNASTGMYSLYDPNLKTNRPGFAENATRFYAASGNLGTVLFRDVAQRLIAYQSSGGAGKALNLHLATTNRETAGSQFIASTSQLSLSQNGQFVAYSTESLPFVPFDRNNSADVFLRNLLTGNTLLISRELSGDQSANGRSSSPVVNHDGSAVLFTSTADDLTDPRPTRFQEIYIWTRPGRSFIDSDADQMDDAWETSNFGSLTVANRTSDFDADGISDVMEYHLGTGATNSRSVFGVSLVSLESRGMLLQWSTRNDVIFDVEFKDSLSDATWQRLDAPIVQAESYHLVDTTARPHRFYRVVARQP